MKCKFGSQLAVMICAIKTTERQHRVAARMCKCTQTHMHTYIRIHTHTYPNIFIQLYKLYICALLLCAFCKNWVFQIILSLFFCYLYFTVYVFFPMKCFLYYAYIKKSCFALPFAFVHVFKIYSIKYIT